MGDEHWVAGYLYHNRQDPRLLVPWRGGRGFVFNCGKPAGLSITATAIALPVVGLAYFMGALIKEFPTLTLAVGLPVGLVAWRLFGLLRPEQTSKGAGIRGGGGGPEP